MGGVLLTTAGVATVSMFFALHHAVGADIGWSIVLGLAWGVVILNLDRFLVVTMNGARGQRWQMAITVLLRLLLAALVAMVVSMPLVLQIFSGDVNSELPLIAAVRSRSSVTQKAIVNGTDREPQITKLNPENRGPKEKPSSTARDPPLSRRTDKITMQPADRETGQRQRTRAATAYQKWQCEIGGLKVSGCPPGTSGLVGNGFRAKGDQAHYEDGCKAQVTALKGELATANSGSHRPPRRRDQQNVKARSAGS